MTSWDILLRKFADDPDEYQCEGGMVLFTRHGKEHSLIVKEIAGIGLAVQSELQDWVPLNTFIQRDLLELPILAVQICRTLDKIQSRRPVPFVDAPAEFIRSSQQIFWPTASTDFAKFLLEAEPGTTRIVQLMAGAGKGKTVLLEYTALDFARKYQPDPHPNPLILLVDLLGRYVGTIDDAIAGSLNNTFQFPRLTQKDIVTCIQCGWIILALDGFDELVARVGVRDAFYRINELLDQLGGSGSIILSARESFFELYQITSGIRNYLQPRNGSYSTSVLKLLAWTESQGLAVFSKLACPNPKDELMALSKAFENDAEIVLHPFFLTRLADLWKKGERFEKAGSQQDRRARMRYVIETFVDRESGEKWIDRDGNPLLTAQGHSEMLGAIAEEMWRAGSFNLDTEELRIAAEIGLAESSVPQIVLPQILERLPTHAALQPTTRGFTFLHDRFLHYFLAFRLDLLIRQQRKNIGDVLSSRDLPPEVLEWLVWRYSLAPYPITELVSLVNALREEWGDSPALNNIALITARILPLGENTAGIILKGLTFWGDALSQENYSQIEYNTCKFWHIDFSNSMFTKCSFIDCQFGDMRVNHASHFKESHFRNCFFESMEMEGLVTWYSPSDILTQLQYRGALVQKAPARSATTLEPVKENFVRCLEAVVRASEKTCDVCIDELGCDDRICKFIRNTGIQSGILRETTRPVSGPRRQFVRFTVDREKLLQGQSRLTGDVMIDKFWEEARRHYLYRS